MYNLTGKGTSAMLDGKSLLVGSRETPDEMK